MDYLGLLKAIDQKKLNNIVLIHVSEPYLYDMALLSIKRDMIGEDMLDLNFQVFGFENLDLKALDSAIETLPVFADKRVIMINNMGIQKDALKKNQAALDFIQGKFDGINPSTILIMVYRGDNLFKGKFVKEAEKKGLLVEIKRLDQRQLLGFIQKYFRRNGVAIDNAACLLIADRIGYLDRDSKIGLYELENELSKLLNNLKRPELSKKDILEIIEENFEDNIFKFTNALSQMDRKEAFGMLNRMTEDEYFMTFHMVLRHIRNLICVKDCEDKKINKASGMKFCALSPFEYDKDRGFANRFPMEKLLGLHKYCYDIEKATKTSSGDMKYMLERLIIEFCR